MRKAKAVYADKSSRYCCKTSISLSDACRNNYNLHARDIRILRFHHRFPVTLFYFDRALKYPSNDRDETQVALFIAHVNLFFLTTHNRRVCNFLLGTTFLAYEHAYTVGIFVIKYVTIYTQYMYIYTIYMSNCALHALFIQDKSHSQLISPISPMFTRCYILEHTSPDACNHNALFEHAFQAKLFRGQCFHARLKRIIVSEMCSH